MRGRLRGGGIVAAPDRRGRVDAVALAVAILALVGILGLRHRALDQPHEPYLGAYLGSGAEGVDRVADFERRLGATMTVGGTYLGGRSWDDIDGAAWAIDPWARWKNDRPGRLLVVNVPLLQPNEPAVDDATVRMMLRAGASGAFDHHFRALGEHLVRVGQDVILDLGWEMNGTSYSSRCQPDPAMWVASNVIAWTACYPGDDVVDIVGMHTYDQPPGQTFQEYATLPLGLDAMAAFARAHHKRLAIREWGLRERPDNVEYVTSMFRWIRANEVLYQSISDYCPHGVWRCAANPNASDEYRSLFSRH